MRKRYRKLTSISFSGSYKKFCGLIMCLWLKKLNDTNLAFFHPLSSVFAPEQGRSYLNTKPERDASWRRISASSPLSLLSTPREVSTPQITLDSGAEGRGAGGQSGGRPCSGSVLGQEETLENQMGPGSSLQGQGCVKGDKA